jgi:hypothetical protein
MENQPTPLAHQKSPTCSLLSLGLLFATLLVACGIGYRYGRYDDLDIHALFYGVICVTVINIITFILAIVSLCRHERSETLSAFAVCVNLLPGIALLSLIFGCR